MKVNLARAIPLAAVLLLVAPTAAQAATSNGSQRHCVAQASPQGTDERPSMRCYKTFGEAINAATGGEVSLGNAKESRALSSQEMVPASTQSTYVLSVDYRDSNFSGSTLAWYQTSPCGYYQTGSMPSGWNDQISSVIAYSGCATTLYGNINFGGNIFRIIDNGAVASLGSFNDQASSQKWCPTYPCS